MLITIFTLTILGWFGFKQFGNQDLKEYQLTYVQFKKIVDEGNHLIIDVRTSSEFKSDHVPNAINANVLDAVVFDQEIKKVDKSKPVYIYCRSGRRSQTAYKRMQRMGFKEIYEFPGGYSGWKSNQE
ncbi:rhodanese-like domain-containing protein [Flavobacteriaceae bacterium]|nr:rhodanese-like domain-containing protein [Flavobacteriaceae bacterium]